MLSPSHRNDGRDWRLGNEQRTAAFMRFFCAQNPVLQLCRTGQAPARVAGLFMPVRQPAQSGTLIGVMVPGNPFF